VLEPGRVLVLVQVLARAPGLVLALERVLELVQVQHRQPSL